jgi:peptidoglycan hydrolase-like protein with peptidoglycan-binding domain
VRDLQAALNDHGYQLAVDGEAGPRTRAALEAYRIEHQLPSSETAILDLALEPDGDVQIASMTSGHWGLEFECGTLVHGGWPYEC